MKKAAGITAGVIVVVAAGWLAATWYTGKRIEAETPARLAEVNQKLADAFAGMSFGVEIRQIDYQRHFFTSQARYGVSLTKTPQAPQDLPQGTAEFVSRIEHGPFAKGALMQGKWLPKLAFVHAEMVANEDLKPLFELTQGATPLWSDTVVSYNGDTSGTAGVAPMQISKDGNVLDFSGAHAEGAYEQATRSSTARVAIDRIAVDSSQSERPAKIDAAGITLDLDTRQGQFGFGIGNSSAQVQRIDVEDLASATKVALQSVGYTASLAESGTSLNLEMGYQVGQVDVNGRNFGKGQATIKLDRLDGQATADLSKLYNEIFTEIGQTEDPSAALTPERRQALLQSGTQVLAGNPSLRLDPVTWQTAKGESRLALTLDLTKPPSLDAQAPEVDDPRALIRQAIKALDIKVVMSKPMAQDVLSQLLQGQGLDAQQAASEAEAQVSAAAGMAEMLSLGKNDGDNLVGAFHYADGAASLNGNPVPIDELLGNLVGDLGDDDAGLDNNLLGALDPGLVGEILDEMGLAYQLGAAAGGNPVMEIQPGDSGADSLRVEFNDCDIDSVCTDLLLRASFAPSKPVPLRLLNDWNTQNRWTRAYLDPDNHAVLEMDVNAYGGIGDNGADFLVKTFFASVPQFAETLARPPR
ncbi:DUF945 family protein [Bordetella petrii]|nr:DUF945 family protein [Bordetella petrii]